VLRKIEALFLGRRWRRDEYAWRVWQEIEPAIPTRLPEPWSETDPPEVMRMAGRVVRIYQHARRGSKALVDFGPAVGTQDTWWEDARPPVGHWVIVHAHLWLPPGTHSEGQVLWVDRWESWASGDVHLRAGRHQRRLEKEAGDFPQLAPMITPPVGQLFRTTGIAVDAEMDQVMATAAEIAGAMGARTYGPAEVERGRLLSIWPAIGEPTFASVTARPMRERGACVGVSVQSLRVEDLDMVDELAEALKSRLGALEPEASPPERMTEYDRGATRRLESEIQDLLEAMSADPSAWGHLSRTVFEREILFQYLTEFRA
jgi:hypothetical protein